jgi:hypothetical protein
MDTLTTQLRAAMDFADKAQRASLALGQTYDDTRTQLGGTMEGLRGDINQRFGAAMAGLEAGMQGNTAGVARLINQQQLTGTAYQQTAKAFAGLESSLLISRDQTNTLSNSLIQTGAEYQISTDKLVGAIDALKSTFPAQALAGMGDKVMGAVAGLQGELGPQLAGPLQNVMNMVMDTSMEGYERLTKLGISDVRERLSAARSSAEAQQILKDAFVTASNNFKSVAGDASKGFFQIGVASEIFGQQAIQLTTVADNLGKRTKKEGKDAADFGMTLANLKAEILVPFQEGLTKLYPFLLKLADVISGIANIIGQRFKAFAEGLGEGKEALKNFQLGIIDFAINAMSNLRGTFAFAGEIITQGVPMLVEKFQAGFYEMTREGGTIDYIKMALQRFRAAFEDAAQFLLTGEEDTASKRREREARAAARELERLIDRNKGNTFEAMKAQLAAQGGAEGTTSPLGKLLVDAKKSMDMAAKNDPTIKALEEARKSIEAGNGFGRKQNEEIERLNKTQNEINAKTPEIATTPEFLDETANMLGRSIEGILGIGKDSTSAEMLEELRIANEQRAAQGDKTPSNMIDTGS